MLERDTSLDVNTSETESLNHDAVASPAKRKDLGLDPYFCEAIDLELQDKI